MLHFDLPFGIYLKKQAEEIAEKLQLDETTVNGLISFELTLVLKDGEESFVKTFIKKTNEDGLSAKDIGFDDKEPHYVGPYAITFLAEKKGIDVSPLMIIDVPSKVYFEIAPCVWYDICRIASSIENRISRYRILKEINAPTVAIISEQRMLWASVEALEDNKIFADEEDELLWYSLTDAGYSLLSGWSEKALKFFEKRDAEEDERWEREMELAATTSRPLTVEEWEKLRKAHEELEEKLDEVK